MYLKYCGLVAWTGGCLLSLGPAPFLSTRQAQEVLDAPLPDDAIL